MRQFHPLNVVAKDAETEDSLRISLDVPEKLRPAFDFKPGQHLPVQVVLDGKRIRRTYSICSEHGKWPLEIGVRVQPGGQFSQFAASRLRVGDDLEVMPPTGRFHVDMDAHRRKFYVGFAAGSGITPILSIAASVLSNEADSRFALFYGNRTHRSTMFIEDLYALKNRYPERLQLHFVFSQEETEFEINAGRIDEKKVGEFLTHFCSGDNVDSAFICGPDTMIPTVAEALRKHGLDEDAIHFERFGVPRRAAAPETPDTVVSEKSATITVIMDGHKKSFLMTRDGGNIVDAAAASGVELPYSCKGGVCATCRTHVREGEVAMQTNYALEPWEVESGFVLACQSRPVSDQVLLDYDKS